VLVHGSVGGGNDQQRFDRCARMLAPGLKPFAPWETPQLLKRFPGRAQMVEYLDAIGLKRAPGSDESCSIDANVAGISHEDAALEDLATPSAAVQPVMGVRPQDAPDDVEVVTIRVEQGRPVVINGERMTPLACLGLANRIAGRNGLWMRDVVENRINATKCRGLYEAPGMELFGQCVRATYEATVEKHANQLLGSLSALIGKSVYEGRYFDVATRAACAAVDIIAEDATAVVHGHLYKGSLVARSLTEVAHSPGVARQTRFAVGGHRWQVTPDLVQAGRLPRG
jgi:argininosuccinate synthase